MQDDQLFPMLTVFETFMFAAEVRLSPSISKAEKKQRVTELLEQLGLQVSFPALSLEFGSPQSHPYANPDPTTSTALMFVWPFGSGFP